MMKPGPLDRLIFFDLETGGDNPRIHPITEIGAVACCSESLRILDEFHQHILFDPKECDPRFYSKRKYHAKWWQSAKSPQEVAREFSQFLKDHCTFTVRRHDGSGCFQTTQLIAHSAEKHDGPFLKTWYDRLGMKLPAHPLILCSKQRAMFLFYEHKSLTPPGSYSLERLAEYFDTKTKPDHTALTDSKALHEVYQAITKHMLDITETQQLYLEALTERTGLSWNQLLNQALNSIVRQIKDIAA